MLWHQECRIFAGFGQSYVHKYNVTLMNQYLYEIHRENKETKQVEGKGKLPL
jgi:hypothetical protein